MALKYLLYLCLIIAPTQANPAIAVINESRVDIRTKQVKLSPGQSTKVTCTPGGYPLPTIQWKKYGADFGTGTSQSGNDLVITDAQRSDTGHYMCSGVVDRKTVMQTFVFVEVKEEERPKSVKVNPRLITIKGGQNGSIECIPEGTPLPRTQWRKAEGSLSSQARQEGNTLIITNAQAEDAGDYVCHAIVESVSVYNDYARIVVTDPPVTRPPPVPQPQPISPRVTVSVQQIRLPRGGSRSVECTPEGIPLPQVQWTKAGGSFGPGIRQSGNALVVTNAQDSDRGHYMCNGIVGSSVVHTAYIQLDIVDTGPAPYRLDQLPKPLDVTLDEGRDISISCDFETGDDQQVVTWSRLDQQPLPRNARQSGRELIFQRVTWEDATEYLCKVTGGGFLLRQLHVRLSVNSVRRTVQPRVVIRPDSPAVVRGQTLSLECVVVAGEDVRTAWERVDGSFSSRVENRGPRLVFRNIEVEDAGTYRCIARNDVGETAQTTPVHVTAPASQGSPRVVVSETQVMIPRGGSRTVDCVPEGTPLPRPVWTKESGRFGAGARIEGNRLVITNAQDSDSGNYVCAAVVQGTAAYTAYLQVIVEDVPPPTPPPTLGAPRVTVSESQVRIPRGGSKIVECVPEGSPLPRALWTKESGRFGDSVKPEGNRLVITNAQDSDSGNYVCAAVVQGTAAYTAYLQVMVEDVPPPTPPPTLGAPRVTVSESQVRIPRGGSKIVECVPEGSPLPRALWTKESGRFGDSVKPEGNRLVITNAQDSDSGNYVCAAVVQGTAAYTAYLQVMVEDVPPPTPPPSQGSPRVTVSEAQVLIPRGGSKIVECVPEGSPLPRALWTKESGRFGEGVRIEGNRLVITNAQDSDSGNYACAAVVQGTAAFTAYLQVIVEDVPPPTPPPSQGSPRVTVSETQVTIPRGGSKIVECVPEGSPLPRALWTKESGRFGEGVRIEGNRLVITNAQDSDSGNYACAAVVQGTAAYTAYLQVIVEDVPPAVDVNVPSTQYERPKVTVSEPQLEISAGDSRTVECNPEGYPLPTVVWSKEPGQFASGTRQEGNALVITKASEEDRGNYVCSAVVDRNVVYTDYLTLEVLEAENNINNIDKSICRLQTESAWCFGSYYYYDINEHKCVKSTWGNCGTNANNFESEEACNLACGGV